MLMQVLLFPETPSNSRVTTWKNVTLEELKNFLGLLLHTGTISLSRLDNYWKTGPLFDLPAFRNHITK